ncbi:NAD(P)H-binding protein [Streptomyces galbus]|uniref:KR domain-containing protein n=1 Tax=Streptomyces galbus TaxID=33898 RepID=A0A4V6B005_STRGB|nr:NAD(P)H-binding protein [Streptomyces galbus]TKT08013.1 KR domain-containing protein [Streptomyces galbus]GHD42250.1 NAD(P)-dependent oxidoreductase [Streptomyces galbus]
MIVITGGNGHLARQAITHVRKIAPRERVIAAVRRPEAATDLDVEVRYADYNDPGSLDSAFAGADQLLLVSGTEFGRRITQHTAAVEAAVGAGVSHIVYTSAPRVDTSDLVFAPEHIGSEQVIQQSGVDYTFLRNNWYHENYAPAIREAVRTGLIVGNAGDGALASAARQDYAEAAAVALVQDGHRNKTYELAGDVSWTYAQLASTVADVTGYAVTYRDIEPAERRGRLAAAGAGQGEIEAISGIEENISQGALAHTDGSLSRLIGHPTEALADGVRRILAG